MRSGQRFLANISIYAVAGACLATAVACTTEAPPELNGLTDQTATVGAQLQVQLNGTSTSGGRLAYSFAAADLSDVARTAQITLQPDGDGEFLWTPLAADLGTHAFDFSVTDGVDSSTVTIQITVTSADGGAGPIFRQPLGTGTTVDPTVTPCVNLSVVIDDQANANVAIAQEAPAIDGATLTPMGGNMAQWHWCPTEDQLATDRYTLVLSADDGANAKVLKNYLIVLRAGTGSGSGSGSDLGSGSDAGATCPGANDGDDTEDTAQDATTTPFNATGGQICSDGEDWYHVFVFTGQLLFVDLEFTQTDETQDLDIHLFQDDTDLTPCDVSDPSTCNADNGQSSTAPEYMSFTVPAGCDDGCDYDVVIMGWDGAANSYSLYIDAD